SRRLCSPCYRVSWRVPGRTVQTSAAENPPPLWASIRLPRPSVTPRRMSGHGRLSSPRGSFRPVARPWRSSVFPPRGSRSPHAPPCPTPLQSLPIFPSPPSLPKVRPALPDQKLRLIEIATAACHLPSFDSP